MRSTEPGTGGQLDHPMRVLESAGGGGRPSPQSMQQDDFRPRQAGRSMGRLALRKALPVQGAAFGRPRSGFQMKHGLSPYGRPRPAQGSLRSCPGRERLDKRSADPTNRRHDARVASRAAASVKKPAGCRTPPMGHGPRKPERWRLRTGASAAAAGHCPSRLRSKEPWPRRQPWD